MRITIIAMLLICLMGVETEANSRAVEAARSFIIQKFDLDPESITVEMRRNRSFDEMSPNDSIRVYSTSSSLPRGTYSLKFDIIRDGVIVKTVSTSVKLTIWTDTYVASRTIKRDESINKSDLRIERCDVTKKFGKTLEVSDTTLAIRAVKTIKTGSVIEMDMVEPIPVICRGDDVLIRCTVGQIEITTTGVAREDGLCGDMIEVLNKETNRRISAEVDSPGIVVVTR